MDYKSEYMDTLSVFMKESRNLKHFKYFLDQCFLWMDKEFRCQKAPQIVLLGPGIPEELIWAAGAVPYWVLGGSLGSCAWSDDLVPRDTDPVSRSVLGFLKEPDGVDYSNSLFIVPVNCDSMRKISSILINEGHQVLTIDIPPERRDVHAVEKWKQQTEKLSLGIAKHLHAHISRSALYQASRMVSSARVALRSFLATAEAADHLLSGPARMLVQNSYFYTEDLEAWTKKLQSLTKEIRNSCVYERLTAEPPAILLLGSPVYFPNYKVPFLITDIGLSLKANIDISTMKQYDVPRFRGQHTGRQKLMELIAEEWYRTDASPAYTTNQVLLEHIHALLERQSIDGVVYHVLKGQIEYDFELDALEPLFEKHGIPVFRLETDYQYQDVEQLRIRIEAFSEMLKKGTI